MILRRLELANPRDDLGAAFVHGVGVTLRFAALALRKRGLRDEGPKSGVVGFRCELPQLLIDDAELLAERPQAVAHVGEAALDERSGHWSESTRPPRKRPGDKRGVGIPLNTEQIGLQLAFVPVLIEGLPLWLAETNCWLVAPSGPGGEAVLIDAPPDPTAIIGRLREHDLRLVAIFSTHGHIDHIGGVGSLVHGDDVPKGDHDIEVRIHDADRHMLLDPLGTSGMLGRYLEGMDLRPPEVIWGMDDGDIVSGAGMRFECLHTPGTRVARFAFGSTSTETPPILFSGDHLFQGSIGRTDLPGGSFDALMSSMVDKILPLPDDVQVLPGHGATTTIGWERTTNPFLIELQQRGGTWT